MSLTNSIKQIIMVITNKKRFLLNAVFVIFWSQILIVTEGKTKTDGMKFLEKKTDNHGEYLTKNLKLVIRVEKQG